MNNTWRNVLGVLTGVVIGGAVNMGLVSLGGKLLPPPDGVDVTNMEALAASMHLFEPRHFLFPFLAHAIGTGVGALLAALIAGSRKILMAMVVGLFFLAGGITNVILLPAPWWFIVVDLTLAYLPMAWLGGTLATQKHATES